MTLEERVNRLEKQNRILKLGALLLIILMGIGGMATATNHVPQVVTAKSFVVQDATGKIRATLTPNGLYLRDGKQVRAAYELQAIEFRDAKRTKRARLDVNGVVIRHPNGRVGASLNPSGTGISDAKGKLVSHLGVQSIRFRANGRNRAWYGYTAGLSDKKGKLRTRLDLKGLQFKDGKGDVRTTLSTSGLNLYARVGKKKFIGSGRGCCTQREAAPN